MRLEVGTLGEAYSSQTWSMLKVYPPRNQWQQHAIHQYRLISLIRRLILSEKVIGPLHCCNKIIPPLHKNLPKRRIQNRIWQYRRVYPLLHQHLLILRQRILHSTARYWNRIMMKLPQMPMKIARNLIRILQ